MLLPNDNDICPPGIMSRYSVTSACSLPLVSESVTWESLGVLFVPCSCASGKNTGVTDDWLYGTWERNADGKHQRISRGANRLGVKFWESAGQRCLRPIISNGLQQKYLLFFFFLLNPVTIQHYSPPQLQITSCQSTIPLWTTYM